MSRITRSAMLQMRVTPPVKHAAEAILRRIGLNTTEAIELFFRRMIVDQRLPFEVVALDEATLSRIIRDYEAQEPRAPVKPRKHSTRAAKRSRIQ